MPFHNLVWMQHAESPPCNQPPSLSSCRSPAHPPDPSVFLALIILFAGAVQVASVFSDTSDWAAGEFIVAHMAVKPWRSTLDGMVVLRVIEGSAWLCMVPDDPSDDDEPLAPRDDLPSGLAAEIGRSPAGEAPRLDESRHLCVGDWVCLPSRVRYQISGCGHYDDAWRYRTAENIGPPFRAAYFARVYGETRPTRWNQLYEDPSPAKPASKDAWLEGAGAGLKAASNLSASDEDTAALDGTGRTPSPIKKNRTIWGAPGSKSPATTAT